MLNVNRYYITKTLKNTYFRSMHKNTSEVVFEAFFFFFFCSATIIRDFIYKLATKLDL